MDASIERLLCTNAQCRNYHAAPLLKQRTIINRNQASSKMDTAHHKRRSRTHLAALFDGAVDGPSSLLISSSLP